MNSQGHFQALRLVCWAAALAVPTSLVPARAVAQEPAGAANAQYRKAFDAVEKKDWEEARRLLLPLWDKSHTWDVAIGLGKAEWYLNHHAVGTRYMAFAVANIPPKEKAQVVESLRAGLREMQAGVATVQISVNRNAAEVFADGEPLGNSPIETEVFLDPGTHVFEAHLENAASEKQKLEVVAGKSYNVALVVDPVANTSNGAAPLGSQPNSPIVAAPASPPTDPAATNREPNWTPTLIAGSATMVALVVGTAFSFDAHSAKNSGANTLKNAEMQFGAHPCPPERASLALCQTLKSQEQHRDSSVIGTKVSFVAAGVFAAATIGSYLLWARPESSQGRMSAWVGPGTGGIRIQGSF